MDLYLVLRRIGMDAIEDMHQGTKDECIARAKEILAEGDDEGNPVFVYVLPIIFHDSTS